ncbi:F-box domain-containing protein [Favolaschia claudopus]|uniref:F-box domain-containing protein n=1 Tax=Favolaschia claudopus TaxID=2862362 RepID=A0AAW0AGT6_9AGAR
MATAPHMPDEIVSEVLTPLLKLPDEVFSDTSVKPLLAPGYSSSAYLQVCKAWFRVATPLLYNVVILRTTSQANALADVLESHKEIGQFVKKLRIEGGFGNAMKSILSSTTGITDLYLTIGIYGGDNVQGLCAGLSLVNPRRVILVDEMAKPRKNKATALLEQTLDHQIPKWDKLKTFHFPYTDVNHNSILKKRGAAIALALTKSPTLEILVMNMGFSFLPYLRKLIDMPSFKRFHCQPLAAFPGSITASMFRSQPQWVWDRFHRSIENDSELKARIHCIAVPPTTEESKATGCFLFINDDMDNSVQGESLTSFSKIENTTWPTSTALSGDMGNCAQVRNLTDFTRIGNTTGSTVTALNVRLYSKPACSIDPNLLLPFTSLVNLYWSSEGIEFSEPPSAFSALDKLETLTIRNELFPGPALLSNEMNLTLPCLRKLELYRVNIPAAISFTNRNGAQLVHLTAPTEIFIAIQVFDLCPNLNILTVTPARQFALPEHFLVRSTPHVSLQKIRFSTTHITFNPMFENLQPESFPSLKEIQAADIKWPTTERMIKKNTWIPLSEILRHKGIKFTDRNGLGGSGGRAS